MNTNDPEYLELKNAIKSWLDAAIDEDLAANPPQRHSRTTAAAVCASVLLVLFGAVISVRTLVKDAREPSNWTEVTATYGESKSVTLPDGSVIWLHNDSRLIYPDRFRGGIRQVFSSGEIFADIARDARHPFVLSSSGANVTVKGTKFNFKAYPSAHNIELSLVEGSVDLEVAGAGPARKVSMEAGSGVSIDLESGSLLRYSFDPAEYIPWKDANALYFNDLTLEEIRTQLERIFSVTIEIRSEKLKATRFYASFTDVSDPESVFNALNATNVMRIVRSGSKYIITETK